MHCTNWRYVHSVQWRYVHMCSSSDLKSFVFSDYVYRFFWHGLNFLCCVHGLSRAVSKFCILLPFELFDSWNCRLCCTLYGQSISVFEMSFIHFAASTAVAVLFSHLSVSSSTSWNDCSPPLSFVNGHLSSWRSALVRIAFTDSWFGSFARHMSYGINVNA